MSRDFESLTSDASRLPSFSAAAPFGQAAGLNDPQRDDQRIEALTLECFLAAKRYGTVDGSPASCRTTTRLSVGTRPRKSISNGRRAMACAAPTRRITVDAEARVALPRPVCAPIYETSISDRL